MTHGHRHRPLVHAILHVYSVDLSNQALFFHHQAYEDQFTPIILLHLGGGIPTSCGPQTNLHHSFLSYIYSFLDNWPNHKRISFTLSHHRLLDRSTLLASSTHNLYTFFAILSSPIFSECPNHLSAFISALSHFSWLFKKKTCFYLLV